MVLSMSGNNMAEVFYTPKLSDAEQFINAVYGSGPVSYRSFAERVGSKAGDFYHGNFSDFAQRLQLDNANGAAVCAMVCEGNGGGTKDEHVKSVRAVFAEFDAAHSDNLPDEWPLEPNAIIESSPGNFHVYWRVEDLPLDEFTRFQKAIARRLGSDPTVCNIARLMRLPGFWHLKPKNEEKGHSGVPYRSRLVATSDIPDYSVIDIVGAFDLDEHLAAIDRESTPVNIGGDTTAGGHQKVEYAGRNDALKAQAAAAIHSGKSDEHAALEILRYDLIKHNPPLFTDPTEAQYAKGNAIDNALKFVSSIRKSIGKVEAPDDHDPYALKLVNTTIYQPPKATEWIIDDYMVDRTTALIFGAPGIAKSFIAQDMGMSVATGTSWHGREVAQGAVLYIAGEGHQDLGNRINAWKTVYGYSQTDNFPFYHTEHGINVRDPEWERSLKRHIEAVGQDFRLIIIDTLSTNFGGGDENSGDMTAFIDATNRMAVELELCVLVIHHSGKDKDRGARGNSSIHGNVYTYMPVEAQGEGAERITRLKMDKQKGGPEMAPLSFEMQLVDMGVAADSRGREKPVTSLVPRVVIEADVKSMADAIVAKHRQKVVGSNNQITLDFLRKYAADFAVKYPDEDEVLVTRKAFVKGVKEGGIAANKTAKYWDWAVKEGFINGVKIRGKGQDKTEWYGVSVSD